MNTQPLTFWNGYCMKYTSRASQAIKDAIALTDGKLHNLAAIDKATILIGTYEGGDNDLISRAAVKLLKEAYPEWRWDSVWWGDNSAIYISR